MNTISEIRDAYTLSDEQTAIKERAAALYYSDILEAEPLAAELALWFTDRREISGVIHESMTAKGIIYFGALMYTIGAKEKAAAGASD